MSSIPQSHKMVSRLCSYQRLGIPSPSSLSFVTVLSWPAYGLESLNILALIQLLMEKTLKFVFRFGYCAIYSTDKKLYTPHSHP